MHSKVLERYVFVEGYSLTSVTGHVDGAHLLRLQHCSINSHSVSGNKYNNQYDSDWLTSIH